MTKDFSDIDPESSQLLHVDELGGTHALRLLTMTMAHKRRGGDIGLDETALKRRIKAYCDRKNLNYAAALVHALRRELLPEQSE